MQIGYDLTIEQTQKLAMTPELIQAIKILQFNTQELDNYVQEQLLTNPVLETDGTSPKKETDRDEQRESLDWMEYVRNKKYDDISYKQWEYVKSNKENTYEQYVTADITLPEHLMFQLQFVTAKEEQREIGRYIIESLDENGYMTESVEEIAKSLRTTEDAVEESLDMIQNFEPVGVGARDLKECLMLQLMHSGKLTEEFERVILEHLQDIANNKLSFIAKKLDLEIKQVQEMSDILKTLEPKPGRQFASQEATRYVIPDITVKKTGGDYRVFMNDSNIPRLMVSSYYEKLLSEAEDDTELAKYLSERFHSAVWLIKSIEQRKQTIINVAEAMVKHQIGFFKNGREALKPLTLKQIAEEVGIHESTVSRAINGKYLECDNGTFELKYFFSTGVNCSAGESMSSTSVKSMIKKIIEEEDPGHPLSDQQIADILKGRNIELSRRTVAKYRDEMEILSSSKRKRY